MIRIGLISNPRSQRNRQRMPAMRAAAARHPELLHVELESVQATAETLRDFARREVSLIIVSGGDGTVQKVLTELLNGSGFAAPPPPLALLPSGMTNLIAADVGLRGDPARSLDRLCRAAPDGAAARETLRRPVLSLQRAPDEPPVHGMFLGAAAFYQGIMAARTEVHPLGARHNAAAALALALALFRLVTGRRGANMLHGERMTVELDGAPAQPRDELLFLATTLQRLILGVMPFWGEGTGALRYTRIGFPPQRLWRALLPVLRGRPRPWMAACGYRSGKAGECRLTLDSPIVFDGEIFRPDPGVPVVLRADRQATFLRC
jgi:hypothetical protein